MYDLIKLSKSSKLDAWRELFDEAEDELRHAQNVINRDFKNKVLFPDEDKVFRAFELIRPEDINVVIFGQDPYMDYITQYLDKEGNIILYPTKQELKECKTIKVKRADGLAFSSSTKISPSLINIYQEIDNEFRSNIREYKEKNNIPLGDLSNWCKQGVMLLNTSLVAVQGNDKVLSIWKGFIQRVVNTVENINSCCVYMLWGAYAIELGEDLNLSGILIKTSHPSPKSASREVKDNPSFLGSDQFLVCNEELKKLDKKEINWVC